MMFKSLIKCLTDFIDNYNRTHIKKRQYYDENAMYHMRHYISLLSAPGGPLYHLTEFNEETREINLLLAPKMDERIIDEHFGPNAYKGGLKKIDVNEGVTRIGKQAFAYNLNLAKISLPLTLIKIDSKAFLMCDKLKSISIPANVVKIGREAFDHNLQELYLYAKRPPKIGDLGISNECKIYIPNNIAHLYFNNRKWKRYHKQIIVIDS